MLLKQNLFDQTVSYRDIYHQLQSVGITKNTIFHSLNNIPHGYIIFIDKQKLPRLSYRFKQKTYGLVINAFNKDKFYIKRDY